jgi:hypothetical protein
MPATRRPANTNKGTRRVRGRSPIWTQPPVATQFIYNRHAQPTSRGAPCLDFPPGGGHRGYTAVVDGSGLIVACCCSHAMGGSCPAVRPLPRHHRHRAVRPAGRAGDGKRAVCLGHAGVLGGRQRQLPSGPGIDRPAGGGLADPAAGAPAGPRLLVEPGRDLPVHLPAQGPTPHDFADLDEVAACWRSSAATSRPRSRLPGALPGPTLSGCCTAWPARSGCWQLPDRPASFEWTNPCHTRKGIYHCRYGMAFDGAHPRGLRLVGGPR